MIPGSSLVAMVILLSSRVVTIRCVGMLVLGTCDIFIADSMDTYLFRVGNVGTTMSQAREKRQRELILWSSAHEQMRNATAYSPLH